MREKKSRIAFVVSGAFWRHSRVKRPYWGMGGRRSLNVYGPDLES